MTGVKDREKRKKDRWNEEPGTSEDLLWELEERTIPNCISNGAVEVLAALHARGLQPSFPVQKVGKKKRYPRWREESRVVTATRRKVYTTSDADSAALERYGIELDGCFGVELGEHGRLRCVPGAAGTPADTERVERALQRFEELRRICIPMEEHRAANHQGAKRPSKRSDCKAASILVDEYYYGRRIGKNIIPPVAPDEDLRRKAEQFFEAILALYPSLRLI